MIYGRLRFMVPHTTAEEEEVAVGEFPILRVSFLVTGFWLHASTTGGGPLSSSYRENLTSIVILAVVAWATTAGGAYAPLSRSLKSS